MKKEKKVIYKKTGNWEEFWTDKNYANVLRGEDGKFDVNVFPAPVTDTDDVIETWLGVDRNKVKKVLSEYGIRKKDKVEEVI
jgi:hypothetical protein